MWVESLAVLVLCACGGARTVVVENRGGTAGSTCDLPPRLEFEARRYGNVDADALDYQTWSSWRVGIVLELDKQPLRGTIAMVGDELVWNFGLSGKLDDRCKLDLWAITHDPIHVTIDVRANTGDIRSIDDVWLLGPPFPAQRP